MNKWDPVIVVWIDAHVDNSANESAEYIVGYRACRRSTLGFFLAEQAGHLFIAETRDTDAGTAGDCERISAIPRAMIESVVHLIPRSKRRDTDGGNTNPQP